MRKPILFVLFLVITLFIASCNGEKTPIKLVFESNGGNQIEDMEISTDDNEFNLPLPIREGYSFDGWFLDPEFNEAFTLLSLLKGESVTLYAKWTANTIDIEYVTVTFITNNGSIVDSQEIVKGSLVTEPAQPLRDSHLFDGWFIDVSLTNQFNFTEEVVEDLTLYARWEIKVYSVIFMHEDGTQLKVESVNHGSDATPPTNPIKLESTSHTFVFSGWDKPFVSVTSNLTVNAVFTGTIKTYTVNFYDADETTLLKTETVPYGFDAIPPSDPTKESTAQYEYTFLGWDKSYIVVTANLNIYAMYTQTVKTYTVNFYDADETTLLKTENVAYGADATPPVNPSKPESSSHTFLFSGWDKSYTNITGALNIYATYTQTVKIFTVNFYDIDGTTLLKTQEVTYGEEATPPVYTLPTPTDRTKFEFTGFDRNVDVVVENINTVAQLVTYYKIVYSIIFDPETPINQNYTIYSAWYQHGDLIPELFTPPLVDGYTFDGWKILSGEPYVPLISFSSPIELFGLYYMEIDETRLYISQAHESETNTIGLVEAVVYIVVDDMGFFIFDETGHILVVSQEIVSIGDKISFEAKVDVMEGLEIHILTINSGFSILSSSNPLPIPIKMSIQEILSLDYSSWVNFGQLVETQGILNELIEGYYLTDIFGDSTLQINTMKTLSPDPFEPLINERVKLSGFIISNPDFGVTFIIYVDDYVPVEIVIPTDQDLMDELVTAASAFLNHLSFYSGETLNEDFITPPDYFNATVIWETFGTNAHLFSFDTLVFAVVDEIKTIDVRITITIGALTEIITVEWYLKPIISTSVMDVLNGDNEEYYIIEVVILYLGSEEEPMIVADETGIILVFGKVLANVGDLVVIKGLRYEVSGMIAFFGTPEIILFEIKATHQQNPVSPVIYTLTQIQDLPVGSILYPTYIQTSGTVFDQVEFKMGVILITGDKFLPVMGINEPTIAALKSLDGLSATLQGVLFAQTDKMGNTMYYMVYFNYPGSFDIGEITNEQKIQLISNFIASLNLGELREGDILNLPDIHPLFGIEINWLPSMATSLLVDSITLEIQPLADEAILNYEVTFLVGDVVTTLEIEYVAYPIDFIAPPFTPGYLGVLPTLPIEEAQEGEFIGLFVYKDGMRPDFMSVMQREVHLKFPMPDEIGATHYTIQYYDLLSETWVTVMDYDTVPITLYYDNVTLRNPYYTMYRLFAHGIDIPSNYVTITSNVIHTEFLGYSLDESVYLSDVIAPFVGRGLEASCTVYDYDKQEYVEGYVSYQWYKVHPVSFQMILIPGATNPLYITTIWDVGYHIMVKISGDGVNVGGYMQIISYWGVLVPVEGYISDITEDGFTLNLSHFINIDDLDKMVLMNGSTWELIPIISITQGENAAIFYIEVDLTDINDGFLIIETDLWVLVSTGVHIGHMMQDIYIIFKSMPDGPPPPDGPPMPT